MDDYHIKFDSETIKEMKKHSEYFKNKICKIYNYNNGVIQEGTGFFCIVPLEDNESIKVLITSSHFIGKENLEKKEIKIILGEQEKMFNINLNTERIIYTNEEISLIEIKDSDEIKNESFLQIDPWVFTGYGEIWPLSIYLISFLNELQFSNGTLEHSHENRFFHTCYSVPDSLGGPLINQSNKKVIGIHGGTINSYLESKKSKRGIVIFLKEPIEEFKKLVYGKRKKSKNKDTPKRINSLKELGNKYEIKEKLLTNELYTIYLGYNIDNGKKVILKEYDVLSNEKLYDYIKEELSALCKIQNKFIIKLRDYYLSTDKTIFVFDYFQFILKSIKKEFSFIEIQKFLIQINEALQELSKNKINDIVLSPENICLDNNNFKLINLFPFYRVLKETKIKLDLNIEKYINIKLFDYEKRILWNIGALIYEMHFLELPNENISIKKKYTKSRDFNNLIENLLQINKNEFTFYDYINSDFLKNIDSQKKFMLLYGINIDNVTAGLNLQFNDISEQNLLLLSKIKLNNLYWLNLSENNVNNIEFIDKSLMNLKILILEYNNIKGLDFTEKQSYLENLENLYIGSNFIKNINFFTGINLMSLTCLSLCNNYISDISSLDNCSFPNLETLNLSFNQIVNISPICKNRFINLTNLYLNNNNIRNIDYLEKSFPILEILNMENNSIIDINVFNKVLFINNIKELYLNDNPITEYEKLNLCYFPSIKKIYLYKNTKKNENLMLLSIKLKLFGYKLNDEELITKEKNEINKIIDISNNKISILFIPDYCSYNINKYIDNLNNSNTFKIIANSDVTQEELENFFIDNILDISNEKLKKNDLASFKEFFDKNMAKEKKYNNYSIIFYNVKNKNLDKTIKYNTISLADEYKKIHEITEKYNRVPGYLGKNKKNLFYNIKCELSNEIENYYKLCPDIIVDKSIKLSEILKQTDYYQRLPLLFINNIYYKEFIQFLDTYYKYKSYRKYNNIFLKRFIIPYDRKNQKKKNNLKDYLYLHYHDYWVFAEVIENINYFYYEQEEVNEIIYQIKNKISYNYRKLIKNWIIIIFDIMNDYILFILNKTTYYHICPNCKNPLLFIEGQKKEININEITCKDYDEDPFFHKSLKIASKLLEPITLKDYGSFPNINLNKPKVKEKGIHMVANPPKEDEYINLIYLNTNSFNSIQSEIDNFKNETNGLFIYCDSIETFEDVIDMISHDNTNECIFYLISNGRSFQYAMNYYNNMHCTFIKKTCIFCENRERYLPLLNNNNYKLEEVYTTENEVIQFISKYSSSRTKIYKSITIISYEKYTEKYYKMHRMFSKYYKENPTDNFSQFYNIIREEFMGDSELLQIFSKFEQQTNITNATSLITDYSGDHFYHIINEWARNIEKWSFDKKISNNWLSNIKNFFSKLNFFNLFNRRNNDDSLSSEKKAYFIGQLMFKVNFKIIVDKNNNNNRYGIPNMILYRGMHLNYIIALSYPIQKGKIITFSSFTSTSRSRTIAGVRFAEINKLDERTRNHEYSVIMKITVRQNIGLFPLHYELKEEETKYPEEEEHLFNPFNFFRVNNFRLDHTNKALYLDLEAIGKREILELCLTEKNKIVYNEENNIMGLENCEYYLGDWSNGLKNGRGTVYYKDDTIKYEGDFVNDKFEGFGIYYWKNGDWYEGYWSNNLRNGEGKVYYRNDHFKYKGFFVNDKYEGGGVFFWEDGQYYEGQFSNGLRNGYGTLYYRNGNIKYRGKFVNDKYEGEGRYNWENGEYYEGQYSNGLKNGYGTLYYRNGNIKYRGNFVNDKFEGRGKYIFESGNYYDGNWLNGNYNGFGRLYYNNNSLKYEGNFLNGRRQGRGSYFWENGDHYIGEWLNDQRHGRGTMYDADNNITFKGNFENDNYGEQERNCLFI